MAMYSKNGIKMGRPTLYSEEWADAFCAEISEGGTIHDICKRDDQPANVQVYRWLDAREDFRNKYARARESRAHQLFAELITIADTPITDQVQAAWVRNRLDARKFSVGRLCPRIYGDRVATEQLGADGKPVTPSFQVTVAPYPEPAPAPAPAPAPTVDGVDTKH